MMSAADSRTDSGDFCMPEYEFARLMLTDSIYHGSRIEVVGLSGCGEMVASTETELEEFARRCNGDASFSHLTPNGRTRTPIRVNSEGRLMTPEEIAAEVRPDDFRAFEKASIKDSKDATTPPTAADAAQEPGWLPGIMWMDSVEEREWDCLWPDKIPLGALVVFHGHGDLGKSWVCVDMACRASTGVDWPGGVENTHGPIKSLLIGAEDDPERTIIKRIHLQDGDASKIAVMSSAKCGDEERLFSLQLDVAGLEQRITEEGIKLVFIDPITEFYGESVRGNNNEDVRRVLSPWCNWPSGWVWPSSP